MHISFLIHLDTLKEWANKTLSERAVLFHRKFGEIKISAGYLGRIYARHGIKRKVFNFVKTLRYESPNAREEKISAMKEDVRRALLGGRRVIFTDEAMFTTSTLQDRAYATKGNNIALEEKLVSSPAIAVVAGVSADRGLEAFHLQPRSIDSEAFIQFLLSLLSRSKASDFVIFMDNCRVHHSRKVQAFMKEHGVLGIFNVPYGPEYNPIERVWAQVKIRFKKERLGNILGGVTTNYEKTIRQIMLSLPEEMIKSICKKTSISKLNL
jgi:putative transposase